MHFNRARSRILISSARYTKNFETPLRPGRDLSDRSGISMLRAHHPASLIIVHRRAGRPAIMDDDDDHFHQCARESGAGGGYVALEMTSSCTDGHGRTDYGGGGREESFAVTTTTRRLGKLARACVMRTTEAVSRARETPPPQQATRERARPVVDHRERVRPRATHLLVHGAV